MSDKCPHKVRDDLPELTERIARLRVDERGYPVPFFVAYIDGKPDFRMTDPEKLKRCVNDDLCWVCGNKMGRYKSFTVGPMCVVNRTSAEPPEHLDCAQWSVRGCPFLSKPQMKRREDETTREMEGNVAGVMIKRNPGAIAIFTTEKYTLFKDGRGGVLFNMGDPIHISWWKLGQPATYEDVKEATMSGVPLLEEHCIDVKDRQDLACALAAAQRLWPTRDER